MNFKLEKNPNKLFIFHELKKRRIYVGQLMYDAEKNVYILEYDKKYVESKNAIPLSPDLDLFKTIHISQKNQIFPVFLDRIPDRSNPAYKDYCFSQGISEDEQNPIILLGSIGARGASSFVFEPDYQSNFNFDEIIKIRKELDISQNDLALAFGIKKVTLQRIEAGIGQDKNTMKLLEIFFTFPEIAIWQLKQTGNRVHIVVLSKLINYFKKKNENHF